MQGRFSKVQKFSLSLLVLFLFLLSPTAAFSQEVTFSYDSEAKINKKLNNTVVEGYSISMNFKYPYIYFKNPENKRQNYATYNYGKQFWVFYTHTFDPAKIDLKAFFLSVDLSKAELNRDSKGRPAQSYASSPAKPIALSSSNSPSEESPPMPRRTNTSRGHKPWTYPSSFAGDVSEKKIAYFGARISDERKSILLNYAKNVPVRSTVSASLLADYLTKECQNEYEKAWVIYCWEALNVAYGTETFFSGRQAPQDAATVLRTRKGLCSGYANLFIEMGEAMGLEIAVISGHGKGFGYHPSYNIHVNHAWTGVRIEGGWILVDATWGAGYLNNQHAFQKKFNAGWFDVVPEQMVFSHLPSDLSYLLTPYLWSVDEYRSLPKLRPSDFSNEFTPEFVLSQKALYSPEVFIQLAPMMPYFIENGITGVNFFKLSLVYTPEEMNKIRSALVFAVKSGFMIDEYIAEVTADKSVKLVTLSACPTVRKMGLKVTRAPIRGELEFGKTYTFEFSVGEIIDYAVIDGRGSWFYIAPEGHEGQGKYRDAVGTVDSEGFVKISYTCNFVGGFSIVAKREQDQGYFRLLQYTVLPSTKGVRVK